MKFKEVNGDKTLQIQESSFLWKESERRTQMVLAVLVTFYFLNWMVSTTGFHYIILYLLFTYEKYNKHLKYVL